MKKTTTQLVIDCMRLTWEAGGKVEEMETNSCVTDWAAGGAEALRQEVQLKVEIY